MPEQPLHPLLDPVREEVLKALKFLGAAASEEVATMCHLSHGAARMHLVTLRNLGLVEYGRDKALRPGRPRHLFWLTPEGDALFPRAEHEIADALLRSISELAPGQSDEVVAHTADIQFEKVMRSLPEIRWLPARERLQAVLEHCGYFPEFGSSGDGRQEAVLRHCPIWTLAHDHESLCVAEARFLDLVLANESLELKRVRHRRGGEAVCSYVFGIPDDRSADREQARRSGIRE